jgi:hypothetical protein
VTSTTGECAGDVYGARIIARLDAEERRATSLQTRGLAVITTSAAIVGLLAALGPVAAGPAAEASMPARVLLGLAALAYVVAGGLGLYVATPRNRPRPDAASLKGEVEQDKNWRPKSDGPARQSMALGDGCRLLKAESVNDVLADRLVMALTAEAAGALLGVAAIAVRLLSS